MPRRSPVQYTHSRPIRSQRAGSAILRPVGTTAALPEAVISDSARNPTNLVGERADPLIKPREKTATRGRQSHSLRRNTLNNERQLTMITSQTIGYPSDQCSSGM
jgi:hypothetical protein